MEQKVYAVFDRTINYDDEEVKDEMVCVCKTEELARQICAMKPHRWFMECDIKTSSVCAHFRNDDGCTWCEKDLWCEPNDDKSDCKRNCSDRFVN